MGNGYSPSVQRLGRDVDRSQPFRTEVISADLHFISHKFLRGLDRDNYTARGLSPNLRSERLATSHLLLLLLPFFVFVVDVVDRLCGLVVRVSGYRYRGLGFDSRRYQIF